MADIEGLSCMTSYLQMSKDEDEDVCGWTFAAYHIYWKKPPKACDHMCKAVIKAKNVACEKLFI